MEKGKSEVREVCWEYGTELHMNEFSKDMGEIRIIFGMQ